MKFAYEIQNKTVKIFRCFGYGRTIEIPDSLEGYPVVELGPYVFSEHLREYELEEKIGTGQIRLFGKGEEPVFYGACLQSLRLPATLQRIGAYAFYNCSNLKHISFHSRLKDLGAGLFTGCHHVEHLELFLDETGTSCLQEILMELNEELRLTLYQNGQEARIVFPEFYEEGVENTPARILMTQMHGSGMHFRNCFYERKFDFHAYDNCFFRARAQESLTAVLELAVSRLRFPLGLGAEERMAYEHYLLGHLSEAGRWAVERKDMELLRWLIWEFLSPKKYPGEKELLRHILEQTAEQGFTEGTAFLLHVLHQRFSVSEESFEF